MLAWDSYLPGLAYFFDFNKVTGFDAQMFQILALYLAFEVTKNIHIFQGLLGALEDAWVNDLCLASWS